MTETENTNSKDSQENAAQTDNTNAQKDSVTQFIEAIGSLVPAEKAKLYIRATPHGLFVQKEFLPQIIQYYQGWFKQITQQSSELSPAKCMKRFFTSPQPALFYLVEAKQCMVGHLIRREIAQPQRLGIPTYIGSVDDTRRIFHPRDPLLLCMPHIEVGHAATGQEYTLNTARGKWRFSDSVLREFSRLCMRSPRLAKEFPEQTGAVRDAFKVLIQVIEKSHLAKKQQRLLVPVKCMTSTKGTSSMTGGEKASAKQAYDFLSHGTLSFVVEDKNRISACYEVGSRTLFRFIKTEFVALYSNPGERHKGSIEILSPRDRHLACLHVRGQKFPVHPRAFGQFVRSVMHEAPEHSALSEKYSIRECLEQFSTFFQTTENIDKSKIARHLEHVRSRSAVYKVSNRWIFVINRKNVIIGTIDRFSGAAGHHHAHHHQRRQQPGQWQRRRR